MCGIAGIIHKNQEPIDISLLLSMAETLSHRGPDDEKFAVFNSEKTSYQLFSRSRPSDFKGNIGFAHRRLSIIDLSELASQPMTDEEHQIFIISNGEIFNYPEIKAELMKLGYKFFTQSDTEVIIKAYKEWGKDCLSKFNGMWAFVLYDLRKNIIFGARDRFGIKPFYYHLTDKYLCFASEIKALLNMPWILREPFVPCIKDYLFYSRVNTSRFTFFKKIYELEAGHFFEIDVNRGFDFKPSRWWDLTKNLEEFPDDRTDRYEKFKDLLLSAIKLRLRSDVPVGTCLSGGLDSSAIVTLANPFLHKENQKTFSVVHPGFKFDESRYVEEIAKVFHVPSYKISLSGDTLLHDLENIIYAHDEPFTSTSMYAQWKVFQLAKQNGITVTLDGQGADELLAGYPYFKIVYWSELLQKLKITRYFKETFLDSKSIAEFLLNLIMTFSGFSSHRRMISLAGTTDPQYRLNWINKSYFKEIPLPHAPIKRKFKSRLNQRLYEVFAHDGLPALIRYADRNSMAHGLESRMPFLDFRLVSYVFSLSADYKIRNGLNKFIMRKSLRNNIPEDIISRRDKIGFITPEDEWFRKETKDFITHLFDSKSFKKRHFYNFENIKTMYEKHKRGSINASRPLWRVINLELWQRKYLD